MAVIGIDLVTCLSMTGGDDVADIPGVAVREFWCGLPHSSAAVHAADGMQDTGIRRADCGV
jgi:hypothetical protein